jgi:hypothetical protein
MVVIGSYSGAEVYPGWVQSLRAHEVIVRELAAAQRDETGCRELIAIHVLLEGRYVWRKW